MAPIEDAMIRSRGIVSVPSYIPVHKQDIVQVIQPMVETENALMDPSMHSMQYKRDWKPGYVFYAERKDTLQLHVTKEKRIHQIATKTPPTMEITALEDIHKYSEADPEGELFSRRNQEPSQFVSSKF
eukprot:snap_masked-scaffold_16-processed-gene-6.59-mRNA-1 protein AED:1.00 eAED:1.00 QI:0/0/0/0/1/1/2/0/127